MSAPAGFHGEWFPTSPKGIIRWLLGPLIMMLFRNNGIGISDEGITVRGFGTKLLPWEDIETIRPTKGGALVRATEVVSKTQGVLSLPIHHADEPERLISLLQDRGLLQQLPAA